MFFRGGAPPPQPPRSYLPCWLCFTVFYFIHHPFCPCLLPHLLVTFFFLLFIIFLSVFFLLRPLLKRLKNFVVTFFKISFLPILHYPYYVPFCFLSSSYCSRGADMLAMLHCPFIFFTILSLLFFSKFLCYLFSVFFFVILFVFFCVCALLRGVVDPPSLGCGGGGGGGSPPLPLDAEVGGGGVPPLPLDAEVGGGVVHPPYPWMRKGGEGGGRPPPTFRRASLAT